ncbi:hypothetical protein VHEMI05312 [[Torrubiella] hemipterigena]|uniref:RING-type domain-containing protein n=1 Tax=[Torrubiella] hemipterigena TaxID=1531966 RepID=A0A0A1SXL8_9HYPO|nr:hypothetical protein VHEMI05312 [[Torrubiella] hemipterigena]
MLDTCCICSKALSVDSGVAAEKETGEDVQQLCCGRITCYHCINDNARFATYCPYCQISRVPGPLPQGLKLPPSYSQTRPPQDLAPPPYSVAETSHGTDVAKHSPSGVFNEKHVPEDTLHFLNHEHDTISSLSLRYGVPASALRQKNNIGSDHLLQGRKTILIPGEYYHNGKSLSPRPIDGEDEERRKSRIRRFMTTCKVHDYSEAVLYLEQADYDLQLAIEAYVADEQWERRHSRGQDHRSRGLFHSMRRST